VGLPIQLDGILVDLVENTLGSTGDSIAKVPGNGWCRLLEDTPSELTKFGSGGELVQLVINGLFALY
jgi:hypothetical protein